jgi:hypothetical protein
VGNSVRNSVRNSVGNIVENIVENSVWISVGNSVRNCVGNIVENIVENSVRNSVENSVRNSVENSVWISVGNSVSTKEGRLSYYNGHYGIGWESWLSFYDYFRRIGILKNDDFDKYISFHKTGVWESAWFEHMVFVCSLPSRIIKDRDDRLHSMEEAAAQWANGEEYYFIHGVEFKKELWLKLRNKELTPEEAIKLENIEQRTVALQEIGYAIIMEKLGGTVIDRHTEIIKEGSAWSWVLNLKNANYKKEINYELIEIDLKDHEKPARFIKVAWITKDGYYKETLLRVSPECNTAMQAVGWTFEDEEYANEVES